MIEWIKKLNFIKPSLNSDLYIIEKDAFPRNLIKSIDFPLQKIISNELFDSNEFEEVLEMMNNSKDTIELVICSSDKD